jgi:hypothetical protein
MDSNTMWSAIPSILFILLVGGLLVLAFRYLVGMDAKFRPHLIELAEHRNLDQGTGTGGAGPFAGSFAMDDVDEDVPFERRNPDTGDMLAYLRGPSRDLFDRRIESIHKYGPASKTKSHIILYRRMRTDAAERAPAGNDGSANAPPTDQYEHAGVSLVNTSGVALPDGAGAFLEQNGLSWLARQVGSRIQIVVDRQAITLRYIPPYYTASAVDTLARYMRFIDDLAARMQPAAQR